jgi:hypothetical protein
MGCDQRPYGDVEEAKGNPVPARSKRMGDQEGDAKGLAAEKQGIGNGES